MRDYALLFINGKRHEVRGGDVFLSLASYLRHSCGLVGTKVVCAEGDCGACTVIEGRVGASGAVEYEAVNSCIRFVHQCDGSHILTVDALAEGDRLHPVQQAMVECHGSQCGYCTPGFVMAMAGVSGGRSADEVRNSIVGNLCRCTGYVPIVAAGMDGIGEEPWKQARFECGRIEGLQKQAAGEAVEVREGERLWLKPAILAQAVEWKAAHADAAVIAGGTDLGVQMNKGKAAPAKILTIGHLAELDFLEEKDGRVVLGAGASWDRVEAWAKEKWPEFWRMMLLFGSPQIRRAATVGGNVINGSPIADSLPAFFAMDAQVELVGPGGARMVGIEAFFLGYRKVDLRPGELLRSVHLPLPGDGEQVRLYKVSRREYLDISTVGAAIGMRIEEGKMRGVRIAFGGVGPVVVRLRRTEAFMEGAEFSAEMFEKAGEVALGEVTPISDVRGGSRYRNLLVGNLLRKYFWEVSEGVGAATD